MSTKAKDGAVTALRAASTTIEVSAAEAAVEAPRKPNGDAAAALIAAGLGCLFLGITTTLAEVFPAISALFTFNKDVGALSGKTDIAVVAWLVAWVALYFTMGKHQVDMGRAFTISLVLVALGILGTFPIFFQALAGG